MKVVNTFEQMLPFGCLSLSLGLELKSTKYIAGIKSTRSLLVNTTCSWLWRMASLKGKSIALANGSLAFDIVIFAAAQIVVEYA